MWEKLKHTLLDKNQGQIQSLDLGKLEHGASADFPLFLL